MCSPKQRQRRIHSKTKRSYREGGIKTSMLLTPLACDPPPTTSWSEVTTQFTTQIYHLKNDNLLLGTKKKKSLQKSSEIIKKVNTKQKNAKAMNQ